MGYLQVKVFDNEFDANDFLRDGEYEEVVDTEFSVAPNFRSRIAVFYRPITVNAEKEKRLKERYSKFADRIYETDGINKYWLIKDAWGTHKKEVNVDDVIFSLSKTNFKVLVVGDDGRVATSNFDLK